MTPHQEEGNIKKKMRIAHRPPGSFKNIIPSFIEQVFLSRPKRLSKELLLYFVLEEHKQTIACNKRFDIFSP